jgi:preprotein translocase subunit SecA
MSDATLAAPELALPTALRAPPHKAAPDIDAPWRWIAARLALAAAPWRSARAARVGREAFAKAAALKDMSDEALLAQRLEVRAALRARGMGDETRVATLALAAETARRALGVAPYAEQMACAAALAGGAAAEMETGEGKTLAAFLAACLFALAGRGVHVVTANDYLARRDAEDLHAAYAAFGLTVDVVAGGDQTDRRRAAYRADVVYISSKEAAFDYLRDGLAAPPAGGDRRIVAKLARLFGAAAGPGPLQGETDVAIVDEIDSVLVDEAVTPLLISTERPGDISGEVAQEALAIAAGFVAGQDFTLDPFHLTPELTPAGRVRLEAEIAGRTGPWRIRLIREELMRAALAALHTLRRDQHYLVRDGKIALIDQQSGRVTPDRHWSHGLHLMVEVKEGCAATGEKKSLASVSFQRYFRRYATICGMSGTVREVAAELHSVYGLNPVRIPRRLPLRRAMADRQIFPHRDALWREAACVAQRLQERGNPVLLAVRSVREAQRASEALSARGVAHRVLSAAQDGEEADIIRNAGGRGAVTVVTNMAGRGTDIKLGKGVAALGGLSVLICERHESRRVDRQLIGRCARQGDPGMAMELVSREDEILRVLGPHWQIALERWPRAVALAIGRAQSLTDGRHRAARLQLLRRDEKLAKMMAFAGGLD